MSAPKNNNKPMYAQIADDIRYKILNKLVAEDERLPSESELADQYSVSRITSQRALDELEIEGLIYRVRGSGSFVAKSKKKPETKNNMDIIAIILPFNLVQGGGMDILSGAETVAGEYGYYVSLHNSSGSPMMEREIIRQLISDGIKGIIYYPVYTSEHIDLLYALIADEYPIVMIDKHIQDIPMDSVVSDNFHGGYIMTEHLIQKGHKNIAFVSSEPIEQLSSIRERFLGHFGALKDNNIPLNIDNVIGDFPNLAQQWNLDSPDNIKFYCRLLEHILYDKKDITCIQAVSDIVAMDIIRAAQFMGLDIPKQISIVGFDNLDVTTLASPGITTINQDLYHIGTKGAELVIERIKNPGKPIENIRFPVELISRESVVDISKSEN